MVEIPSPFAGLLVDRRGTPGEALTVGSLLVRIDIGNIDTGSVDGPGGIRTPSPASPAKDDSPTPRREPVLVGYGADSAADRSRRWPSAPRPDHPVTSGLFLAKPPVRKLARSLGVDTAGLSPGSGPGGVVTRADVLDAASDAQTNEASHGIRGDVVAVIGIRARIADRMSLSRTQIPDATCAVEADFERLLEVRGLLNDAAEQVGHPRIITPFAVVCRLLMDALRGHRILNATFIAAVPEIAVHGTVHLGIGTSTNRGLVVPVVRDADRLSTLDMALRIAELADGARLGALKPAELAGSTFTVSNFGALGLDDGIPIINYPEAAILGIGSIKPRPVVVDGEVVARRTARLTVAFDHRVCDGAEAGSFLSALRTLVEHPERALLHA